MSRVVPLLVVIVVPIAWPTAATLPLVLADEQTRVWHPPIRITSDADFLLPTSGVVAGLGTAEAPFIIEGWRLTPLRHWSISGTPGKSCVSHTVGPFVGPVPATPWPGPVDPGRAHGLEIRDTTLHVVVRNVYVHPLEPDSLHSDERLLANVYDSNYLSGIYVENAENVTIVDSVIEEIYRGVCVRFSKNFRMDGVTVRDAVWRELEIIESEGLTVHGSVVTRTTPEGFGLGGSGIRVQRSTGFTLSDSVLKGIRPAEAAAVLLFDSEGATVRGSSLDLNGRSVLVFGSRNVRVEENVFFGNSRGVSTRDSLAGNVENVTLRRNNFAANSAAVGHGAGGFLDARENWWGCPEGPNPPATEPECQKILVSPGGFVDASPWLVEPFAGTSTS